MENLEQQIKEYIKNNLSIQVTQETNDFMSTDCSTSTRLKVSLFLEGEYLSSDSIYL